MTSLTQLNIHYVRNIDSARITPHARYNIICGANGSGKTSILEAVYLLSRGHSFRTRQVAPLISYHQSELTVFARTESEQSISVQKSRSGLTKVKINQQNCNRSSELAHFLPCQLIYQDVFQIMDAGASVRRNLLDWGMFHVKHAYHALWKQCHHVLQQRNALLRQQANRQHFQPWDSRLVELSHEIHTLRASYFSDWSTAFSAILAQLTDLSCTIHYDKGWDRKESGKSLAAILSDQFSQDRLRQYTISGPHQADILFNTTVANAKKTLSRGQQKIILIALKLAQTYLMDKPCIYLFDDIIAELDFEHMQRLIQCLSQFQGQFFFTSIDLNQLTKYQELQKNGAVFELNQGVVTRL